MINVTKFPLLTCFDKLLQKICLLLMPFSRKNRRKRYPEKRIAPCHFNHFRSVVKSNVPEQFSQQTPFIVVALEKEDLT